MASENIFLVNALIMGVFITFLYDILRIVRRVVPHGGFLISLEDLGFWIYGAIEVFLLMYRLSDGMLRWFAVLGALFGMFCYKKFISPFFVEYVSRFLCLIRDFVGKVLLVCLRPFGKIWGKCKGFLVKTAGKCRRKAARARAGKRRFLKKKLTFLLKILKMTL